MRGTVVENRFREVPVDFVNLSNPVTSTSHRINTWVESRVTNDTDNTSLWVFYSQSRYLLTQWNDTFRNKSKRVLNLCRLHVPGRHSHTSHFHSRSWKVYVGLCGLFTKIDFQFSSSFLMKNTSRYWTVNRRIVRVHHEKIYFVLRVGVVCLKAEKMTCRETGPRRPYGHEGGGQLGCGKTSQWVSRCTRSIQMCVTRVATLQWTKKLKE